MSTLIHPARRPATCHRDPRRDGMTLVEMVVILALVAIIAAGCGSMILVAAKAMSNDQANVGTDATVARSAADQVVDDLKVATAVTEQTATAVTEQTATAVTEQTATAVTEQTATAVAMTVTDRDGDGQPETIRYARSGTPGDPLTRTYNNRAAGTVAANVRALNFTYLTKTVGRPPAVQGAEQSLSTHVTTVAADVKGQAVNTNGGLAEYFRPAAALTPADPTTSTVTARSVPRCQLQLQGAAGTTRTLTLSLRYGDANKQPTGGDLQPASVSMVSLLATGQNWVEFAFPTPAALDPAKGVCLVVTYSALTGGTPSLFYHSNNTATAITWSAASNGTLSWTTPAFGKAMQVKAWGKVTAQDNYTYDPQPLPPAAP